MVRGTAAAFSATVIGQAFALGTSIVYARLLGPTGLGVFSIYAQLANFAVVVAGLELATPIAKFVAELRATDHERLERLISTVLSISIAATLVASIGVLALAHPIGLGIFGNADLVVMIQIGGLFLLLNSLANVGTAILQGLQRIGKVSILGILLEAAGLPVMFLTIATAGLVGAAIGGALLVALGATMLMVSARRALRRERLRIRLGFDRESARKLMAYVLPLAGSAVVVKLAFLYQSSFLALTLGYSDAGLFRVASTIARIVAFVPGAISVPLLPALSELYATARDQRSRTSLTRMIRVGAFAGAPLALAVGIGAGPLITLLYGPEYLGGSGLAFVLVLAGFVDMINVIATNSLLSDGRTRLLLALDVGQASGLVVTTTLFIPWFGLNGVGYSAAISAGAYCVVTLLLLGRRERVLLGRVGKVLIPATASLLLAGIAITVGGRTSTVPVGALIIGAWILGSWILMEPAERQVLRGAPRELLRR